MGAMLLVRNKGKAVVFKARTEEEDLDFQTLLQRAGLASEVEREKG